MSWFDIIKRFKPDLVLLRQIVKELGEDSGYIELKPDFYDEVYKRYMDKASEKIRSEYFGRESQVAHKKHVTSFANRFKRNRRSLVQIIHQTAKTVYAHKGIIGKRVFYANDVKTLDKLGIQRKQENTLAQQRAYRRRLQ